MPCTAITLQWGRDQLIAETYRRWREYLDYNLASMGPRSIDRGNGLSWMFSLGSQKLQWGRDQLIAETLGLALHPLLLTGLQWGRDQLIAETQPRWPEQPGYSGFNGAAIN